MTFLSFSRYSIKILDIEKSNEKLMYMKFRPDADRLTRGPSGPQIPTSWPMSAFTRLTLDYYQLVLELVLSLLESDFSILNP